MANLFPPSKKEEEEVQESGNPDPFHFFQDMFFGAGDKNAKEGNDSSPLEASQKVEAVDKGYDLEASLEDLKHSPNYEKLKTQLKVLTPQQQKAAIDYALKCQEKIKQKRAEKQSQDSAAGIGDVPQQGGSTTVFSKVHMEDAKLLDAARHGDVGIIEELLPSYNRKADTMVVASGDSDAHPLLHWAVLEDQIEMAEYLLHSGAPVDGKNPRGETALHWASLRGNVRSVHLLLEHGADFKKGDDRGYCAMHHAAQFGKTVVLAQLHRRGAVIDIRDNLGRTPLHWAAYKNEVMAAQWLISHGANVAAEDFENCMPIHWAALQGLKEMAATLVDLGSLPYLDRKDKTGKTPSELAFDKADRMPPNLPEHKKYLSVASYLQRCIENGKDVDTFNQKQRHFTWYLWPIMAPPGWYTYYYHVFPETNYYTLLTFIFWTMFLGMNVSWTLLQIKDPGYIVVNQKDAKKNSNSICGSSGGEQSQKREVTNSNGEVQINITKDDRMTMPRPEIKYSQYYRDLYDEVLDKGLTVPVCTTCEIVRPLRSKHDRFTNRCVVKFDHYCPWVGCAIGGGNYREFYGLMLSGMFCMNIWVFFVLSYTYNYNAEHSFLSNFWELIYWECFVLLYFPIALYALVMCMQHGYFIQKNMTTNEMMNQSRYEYLRSGNNPFDRGVMMNIAEFCGLVAPVEMDIRQYYQYLFDGNSEEVRAKRQFRSTQKRPANDISITAG